MSLCKVLSWTVNSVLIWQKTEKNKSAHVLTGHDFEIIFT